MFALPLVPALLGLLGLSLDAPLRGADAPLVDVFHVRHVIPRHDWSYWAIEDLMSVEEAAGLTIDFTVDSGPPVRVR